MFENSSASLDDACLLSSVERLEAIFLQNTVFVSSPKASTAACSSSYDEKLLPTAKLGMALNPQLLERNRAPIPRHAPDPQNRLNLNLILTDSPD